MRRHAWIYRSADHEQQDKLGSSAMRSLIRFAVLASLVTITGCSQPVDIAAAQERLLARDREWSTAAMAGQDVERIVSYWSDDALVVPSGQPIVEGKAAIRAFVAASLKIPGFKIHWTSERPAFSPDGQVAYMRATNEMTVPGENGPITITGRGVTVWRVEKDGQWRCVVDIWNDAPPPAAAP
jgi:ketosteroid isomerase-like protein